MMCSNSLDDWLEGLFLERERLLPIVYNSAFIAATSSNNARYITSAASTLQDGKLGGPGNVPVG